MPVFPSTQLLDLLKIVNTKLFLFFLAPRFLHPFRSRVIPSRACINFTSFHTPIATTQSAVHWDRTFGHHRLFRRLGPLQLILVGSFFLPILVFLLQEGRNFWGMIVQIIAELDAAGFQICLLTHARNSLMMPFAHGTCAKLVKAALIWLWWFDTRLILCFAHEHRPFHGVFGLAFALEKRWFSIRYNILGRSWIKLAVSSRKKRRHVAIRLKLSRFLSFGIKIFGWISIHSVVRKARLSDGRYRFADRRFNIFAAP